MTKILPSNRITKTKRKPAGFSFKPIAVILGVVGLALTIYIGYRTSISDDRKLFSFSLIALFAGLLFESFRVSDKWKNVIYIFVGAYFLSLLNFFPGKNEKIYNFENHIETWPYFFIIFFTLAFAIINKDKVTAKLSEGTTLLLSLSLIYWTIDYGFINYHNWFAITILTIVLILSAFSILNALTNIQLSKNMRIVLSVWSTIIMFAFAVDNIIRVFSNQDIESSKYLSQALYIGLQYFFLGISAIYIMQNYMLLRDLKENIKNHIDRYSDKQVFIGHSLFCILYASSIFLLNHTYQVLPTNTMIWFVFLTFPLILQLIDFINGRKKLQPNKG